MIKFDELRITPDGKNLIIKAEVKSNSYYSNVYIDSITIDNQNTYIENGPSDKSVYSKVLGAGTKSIAIVIDYREVLEGLKDNILFIYVKTSGTPASDTPCGMDNITTIGVVYNEYPIFQSLMRSISSISDSCNVPMGFIDMNLKIKALELAVSVGDYTTAIDYWNKYFTKSIEVRTFKNCGCNG